MSAGGRVSLDQETSRWLAREVIPGRVVMTAEALSGGYTNDMVLVTTRPRGERYILRRYRHSDTQVPRIACDVEASLLRCVSDAVPVPEVVGADEAGARTGRAQLVYRLVDGGSLAEAMAGVTGREASDLGRAVGTVLARIGPAAEGDYYWRIGLRLKPCFGPDAAVELPCFVKRCLAACGDDHKLSAEARQALWQLAATSAGRLKSAGVIRQLVHSDFNPKNVLVARPGGRWRVVAVLDWEQAGLGSPLIDVGNMLRFEREYPAGFADGFVAGFGEAGGRLPPEWRAISQAFDLFALTDILTHPPDDVLFARALDVLERRAQAAAVGAG